MECLLLLFFMCVSFSISYAQDAKVITGKVLESPANTPLAGVTVLNKSTNKTTVSDFAGQFKIQAKSTDLLVISNIGFESQQITVGTAKSLNIAMVASTAVLNDVVVIGYGSVRKKDLTGSVSQVNMKELSKAPVGDFAQALSGRLAGVRVNSSDGQPGVTPNIVIRGTGSLTKSTSPLFVVDGFPLEDFNPN
ncbi:MAG: carboxypeptidase-like regulatory domain-containing protein, partial [Sediminibacterium sp.]